jgi:hypothetical protein
VAKKLTDTAQKNADAARIYLQVCKDFGIDTKNVNVLNAFRHAKADLGSRASRSFARHHVSHMKPKVTTKISMVVRKTYVQDRRSRRVASWASWRWSSRTTFAPSLSRRTDKIGLACTRFG